MEPCRLAATDLACRRGERLLFRGLSLDLRAGDAIQIAGPNGMGKSSLIRILAGLLRPYAGEVHRVGTIGLMDERAALDGHLPLGRALGFWQRIDTPAETAIERLGLASLLELPVRYLSTGQRKRAALARLLGQQASVWLLDEPLNGLDVHAVELCEALVAEHCAAGGLAVIASHQPFAIKHLQTMALAEYVP